MSFTTVAFLIFFGIVFWGYYLVPKKYQWIWLLISSMVFYAYSAWWALLYLLGTVLVTYGGARWLDYTEKVRKNALSSCAKEEKKKIKQKFDTQKKWILALLLLCLVGLLVVVKYTNFFLDLTFKFLVKEQAPVLSFLVPVGLSFYLFQTIGYLIDVYRGQYEAEKNVFKFALYVSYFPHILQGPLDDYQKVSADLYGTHEFHYENVVEGAKRAAWGFFKKLVIANQCFEVLNPIISVGGSYDGLTVVTCIFLFAVELYADFSGYMDIACGCSKMLGIEIAENFDTPYFSGSIAEFWRRWHITLGTWFKNYVFYPILRSGWCSGLRKALKKNKYLSNTVPNVIALVIVWLLIGFWHGANVSYVLYGIYHGSFIVLETILAPVYDAFHKKFPKVQENKFFRLFRIVRTFALVCLGYYLFAPASISLTVSLFKYTFSAWNLKSFVSFVYYFLREFTVAIIGTIILFVVEVRSLKKDRLPISKWIAGRKPWVRYVLYCLMIFAILLFMVYGGESSFAYFKF